MTMAMGRVHDNVGHDATSDQRHDVFRMTFLCLKKKTTFGIVQTFFLLDIRI